MRQSGAILSLKQEAQLSQRDRALLRVIEYFAKSLKVTEDYCIYGAVRWTIYDFNQSAIVIIYCSILYYFRDKRSKKFVAQNIDHVKMLYVNLSN